MDQIELDRFIEGAVSNDEIPQLYFNGLTVRVGPGDTVLILKRMDAVVGVLYMSHVTAKTLVSLLGRVLSHYEERTNLPVLSLEEIEGRLEEVTEKEGDHATE